jgi:hypothetical protein
MKRLPLFYSKAILALLLWGPLLPACSSSSSEEGASAEVGEEVEAENADELTNSSAENSNSNANINANSSGNAPLANNFTGGGNAAPGNAPINNLNAGGNAADNDLSLGNGANIGENPSNSPSIPLPGNSANPFAPPVSNGVAPTNAAPADPFGAPPATSNTPPVVNAPPTNAPPMNNSMAPPLNTPPVNNSMAPPANTPLVNNASMAPPPGNIPPETAPPDEGTSQLTVGNTPAGKMRPLSAEELELAKQAAVKLRNLAPGEGPTEYVVQPGDTLWDISDQLLDDPFWWPKLWSLNPSVENPNLIYPGMKLSFFPSNGENSPSVSAKDSEEAVPMVNAVKGDYMGSGNALSQSWRTTDGTLIDPSELPDDKSLESIGDFDATSEFVIDIPGYLSTSSPDFVGTIIDVDGHQLIPGTGHLAFAKFGDTAPAAGQRFLTVRKMEPVRFLYGGVLSLDLYSYTGTVGVAKVHPSGLATLLIENSSHGITAGDFIVPYKGLSRAIDPNQSKRMASLKAEVVAVGNVPIVLSGPGQVIYLKSDGDSGAAPGDDFSIYMPVVGMATFQSNGLEGDRVAKARVLETSQNIVTAVVLEASKEVSVGARTYPEF